MKTISHVSAIKDLKTGLFGQPIFSYNQNVAIRSFSDFVKSEKGVLSTNPEDFSLYYIGEYDHEHGEFKTVYPEQIANATQFMIDEDKELLASFEENKKIVEEKE